MLAGVPGENHVVRKWFVAPRKLVLRTTGLSVNGAEFNMAVAEGSEDD